VGKGRDQGGKRGGCAPGGRGSAIQVKDLGGKCAKGAMGDALGPGVFWNRVHGGWLDLKTADRKSRRGLPCWSKCGEVGDDKRLCRGLCMRLRWSCLDGATWGGTGEVGKSTSYNSQVKIERGTEKALYSLGC